MSVLCFTSATFSYLAKARVLGHSLKKFHPDWKLTIVVTDNCPPGFDFTSNMAPFDEVIWAEDLPIEKPLSWLFGLEVVEACTAVKGPALDEFCNRGEDKIIYLDPDTAVFNSLDPIVSLLDSNSVLLTPHQLEPEKTDRAVRDNEFGSLLHGTYNLGFVAIKNDKNGRAFARWWRERLIAYCIDDKANGIFVDQKWCDLAPAYFDGVRIVRDPGYNVASWNVSNRRLSIDSNGDCFVNNHLLRFYHFTKLGPIGDLMTRIYARDNVEVYELWSWYKREVDFHTDSKIPNTWWYYGKFDNGVKIPNEVRKLYRSRKDLQEKFANPFRADSESYFSWLQQNGYALK